MNAVVTTMPAAPVAPIVTHDPLLAAIMKAAADPAMDMDKVERLYGMYERAQVRAAKSDFFAALARLQAALPTAARKGIGHNNKRYARFEDVIDALREPLELHGFSLTYRISQNIPALITVTGVLGHASGHTEETPFSAPPDTSGNKSAVHAIASAVSYCKRYVAMALTGIATDDDDDATAATAPQLITEAQSAELTVRIEQSGRTLPQFCAHFKISHVGALPLARLDEAKRAIAAAAAQPPQNGSQPVAGAR